MLLDKNKQVKQMLGLIKPLHGLAALWLVMSAALQANASPAHSEARTVLTGIDVISVQLTRVTPAQYRGECPMAIEVEGTLQASAAVKVHYRWSHNGSMGPVAVAQLNSHGEKIVSTHFKDIGKTLPVGTLLLSSKDTPKPGPVDPKAYQAQPDSLHTGSVQLLSLPMDQQNWSKAYKSMQMGYKVDCDAQAKSAIGTTPVLRADLLPGPMFTLANASAPWGSTLAVDASAFQAGKRGDQCPLLMTYAVHNEGTAEAAASQASLLTGSNRLHSQNLGNQASGAKTKVAGILYLSDGRHTVSLKVDSQDQVNESSEANNMQGITVMVRGCSGG